MGGRERERDRERGERERECVRDDRETDRVRHTETEEREHLSCYTSLACCKGRYVWASNEICLCKINAQ